MTNQKYYIDKAAKLISCWTQFAKEDSFNGVSLTDYEAASKDCFETRAEIKITQQKLDGLLAQRLQADLVSNELGRKVVQGIVGHPKHGDNSPFYRALGYVIRDERASGLVRPGAEEGPIEPPAVAA